jgi:uncharacterized membrane protein
MAHAESEVTINRPAEAVFNFLSDGLNNPKWRPGVVSIQLASGSSGESGAIYNQVMKGPGGRNIAGDYQLTQVIPGKELGFKVIAGPARPTGVYYFESNGDTTTVKFSLDLQPKGLMRLMSPMIQKTMQGEVALLSNLKQVLEVGQL